MAGYAGGLVSKPVLPHPLNHALPAELTGRVQSWLGSYRRYPVFSAPWIRGRMRSLGLQLGLIYLTVVISAFLSAPDGRPFGGLVVFALIIVVPLWIGPWAGHWVRRQGWSPRHEWWGLVAAMLVVTLLTVAAQWRFANGLKQWLSEQVGAVDEHGRRKRLRMFIGINVSVEDGETPGGPVRSLEDAEAEAIAAANTALIAFLVAGGFALWGWQRERRGLLALQQEHELAQAQAQRHEAEMRLSVLAAQVEPHFLFNTLAGVRSAISTDPKRASEMIDRLADYLRASIPRLRSDGSALSTVAGQADAVRAYLGLMAARMPRLHPVIDVPADLAHARCPPLMLISLAENAVKHGVEPKMGAATVRFAAARDAADAQRLLLIIEDDGIGFGDATSGSGIGLSNIRERLAQLYRGRAELRLSARSGGGVIATLSLPLEFDTAASTS